MAALLNGHESRFFVSRLCYSMGVQEFWGCPTRLRGVGLIHQIGKRKPRLLKALAVKSHHTSALLEHPFTMLVSYGSAAA